MNSIKLNGNLTRKPYISNYTYIRKKDGKEVTSKRAVFTIANNIVKARRLENANFIPVVAFGKVAEIVEKNLDKGNSIILEGFITSGHYVKDGTKISTLSVIADDIEFVKLNPKTVSNDEVIEETSENDGFETIDDINFETFIDEMTEGLGNPF